MDLESQWRVLNTDDDSDVELVDIVGAGRGLRTTRDFKGGEVTDDSYYLQISSSSYRLCWWTLLQLWDHLSDLKMMTVMDASSTKHQVSSFSTLFFYCISTCVN